MDDHLENVSSLFSPFAMTGGHFVSKKLPMLFSLSKLDVNDAHCI